MSTNAATKATKFRWVVCALLLFSTTINYMDRNVIGFLKDYFCSEEGFGWSNQDFSYVTSAFTAFYAGMTLFAGVVIDKIGTKLGLALSLIIWSIFGMANAFVGRTVAAHIIVRSLFGLGEAGNFPASVKTVAEWFPKRERALATGIFNSGSNIGAMICALYIPWCLLYGGNIIPGIDGWQFAFISTGAIGFLWLIFWFILYNSPAKLLLKGKINQEEIDLIESDDTAEEIAANAAAEAGEVQKVGFGQLLKYRQTWSFFVGKFMTDGIWWFLLFWLPSYVRAQFTTGMTPEEATTTVMITNFIVFGVAIFGSVYGGSIPMAFMKKGMDAYKARMTAMFIIACCPLVLVLTQYFGNVEIFGSAAIYLAIGMICIGGAAHQAWSANIFSTVSDMFPKKAVASVTGIGACAGGIGGVLIQLLAGFFTDHFETNTAYTIMFVICALSYLIAWFIMKALVPKFKPVTDL